MNLPFIVILVSYYICLIILALIVCINLHWIEIFRYRALTSHEKCCKRLLMFRFYEINIGLALHTGNNRFSNK